MPPRSASRYCFVAGRAATQKRPVQDVPVDRLGLLEREGVQRTLVELPAALAHAADDLELHRLVGN